jgi:hypothetical protein
MAASISHTTQLVEFSKLVLPRYHKSVADCSAKLVALGKEYSTQLHTIQTKHVGVSNDKSFGPLMQAGLLDDELVERAELLTSWTSAVCKVQAASLQALQAEPPLTREELFAFIGEPMPSEFVAPVASSAAQEQAVPKTACAPAKPAKPNNPPIIYESLAQQMMEVLATPLQEISVKG